MSEFCTWCGRELVEVVEPSQLYDPKTGERPDVVWMQCPRFARSWRNLWLGGCHESFQRDNRMMGREYR